MDKVGIKPTPGDHMSDGYITQRITNNHRVAIL